MKKGASPPRHWTSSLCERDKYDNHAAMGTLARWRAWQYDRSEWVDVPVQMISQRWVLVLLSSSAPLPSILIIACCINYQLARLTSCVMQYSSTGCDKCISFIILQWKRWKTFAMAHISEWAVSTVLLWHSHNINHYHGVSNYHSLYVKLPLM